MPQQFASRVENLLPEGAYAVMAQANALEAQGKRVIHLEIGQPYSDTFAHISKAGMDAIQQGYTRYNPPAGVPDLRGAIARYAGAQRNMDIDPKQVVVGPGAKPGLFFPTLALINPGDEVIYPDPGFPTYPAMIEIAGGTPIPVPLCEENNFSLDLPALKALINDRTRMIILNSPANPTGGVLQIQDLEFIAKIAIDHQIWVMSDEIYSRLVYDADSSPSIAAMPGMAERTIIIDGFSKTYAMTGWRLGYGIMPEEIANRVELLLTHSIGCTATFTQIAGIHALTSSQERIISQTLDYQRRRDLLVEGLNKIPGVRCQKPQGAFYAFPNVSAFGIPVRQLARQLLTQAGVAVIPGTDFGKLGEGYLRLCFATSPGELELAIEKMTLFFSTIY